jgi:hypothetical protein
LLSKGFSVQVLDLTFDFETNGEGGNFFLTKENYEKGKKLKNKYSKKYVYRYVFVWLYMVERIEFHILENCFFLSFP